MSRVVWVDRGNAPNVPICTAYGVTRPYFDITDPLVTEPFLARWKATAPFDSVGVFVAVNWNSAWETDPVGFADWLDSQLAKVAPSTGMYFPHVLVNVEKEWVAGYSGGIPSWVTSFLNEWRFRRATRATSLVFDAFQGGWWNNRQSDIDAIIAANLEAIYVESFGKEISTPDGTALEPFDQDAVVEDLLSYGLPQIVVPCHDGNQLADFYNGTRYVHSGWQGLAFTQGRLK